MVADLFNMPNWDELSPSVRRDRALALHLAEAAVRYADPAQAVIRGANAAGLTETSLRHAAVVSVGKAAAPMMAGLYSVGLCRRGIVVMPTATTADAQTTVMARRFCELQMELQCMTSAHPVPDARSVAAAEAVLAFVQAAAMDPEVERLIFLVSGGGSSLLEAPVTGVSLGDLQHTYRALLASGAPITLINRVRPHLSRVKGGGLLVAAGRTPAVNLVISDVVDGPLEAVASGASMVPLHTEQPLLLALGQYLDVGSLPAPVQGALEKEPARTIHCDVASFSIADNGGAQDAMLRRAKGLGLRAARQSESVSGEAKVAGATFLQEADAQDVDVFIGGGECTVTLGEGPVGAGGRNQEFVLGGLAALPRAGGCLVSLGTDGVDGQSHLAGGLVDGEVREAVRRGGFDVVRALATHDATPLLEALGAGLVTGPTGTNVADVCTFVRSGKGSHLP